MVKPYSQREKLGKAPGSLIFIGSKKVEEPRIEIYAYDKGNISQSRANGIDSLYEAMESEQNSWINVTGIHDSELIQRVGTAYDLHSLQQEAILNTGQRPRFEFDKNGVFIILKMLHYTGDSNIVKSEQVSLVVGERFIITFQEAEADVFGPIRDRLLAPKTNLRNRGCDYMAFALMDAIVDNYMLIIERFGESIEDVEEELLEAPKKHHLELISDFKKELNFLNKNIRPMRELVNQFLKSESQILKKSTTPYLRDLEDHISQAIESIDSYRDILNDHLNLYNSGMNNRLNEIMRVLTIFSVVFIPLTFVAGVYGTNFAHIPELGMKYAYPIFWAFELLLAIGMLWYFSRKNWL